MIWKLAEISPTDLICSSLEPSTKGISDGRGLMLNHCPSLATRRRADGADGGSPFQLLFSQAAAQVRVNLRDEEQQL